MEIIPAILTNSPGEAKAMLSLCDNVSPRTQIDIIDGQFANNRTIFPETLEDEVYTTKLDFHLMVKEPINWIERCVVGNADRIIGQIEHMSDQKEFVDKVVSKGILVGLGVDLYTDVLSIDEEVLALLDVILVMSVEAGFGGQAYNIHALKTIADLNILRIENDFHYRICDDGGVNTNYLPEITSAGTDEVAIGRRLFEGDLEENIEHFKKLIN